MNKKNKKINLIIFLLIIIFAGYRAYQYNLDFKNVLNNSINEAEKKQDFSKQNSALKTNSNWYSPEEYQKLLKVGVDVDWIKVKSVEENYNSQVPKDFKKMGFSHVRIRAKGDIRKPEFRKKIEKVIKDTLDAGLIPVLVFRASDFKIHADKKTEEEAIVWWKKTAEVFKDYPKELSFDLIIEVTEKLNKDPKILNDFYKKAIAEIRKTNPKRIILISPRIRSAPEYLGELEFPKNDKNIMAEFHFYASGPDKKNPKKKWTTGTEEEKKLIRNKIKLVLDFQKKTGRRVWVGAWMAGNYNKGNDYSIAEQEKFATFVVGELQKAKIPYAINSGKRFYNYEKKKPIKEMEKLRENIINNK